VVTVDGAGTRVTWNRNATQIAEAPAWLSVAAPPAETAAADRARHAAVSFGVPAGDDREKVLVAFAGAGSAGGEGQPVRTPWMARAAQSLRESELLAEVDVVVGVEERAGTLIVRAPIAASSAAAPAVIRAAMLSVRPAAIADRALETVTISDKDLAQWRREAAPVAADVVTGVEREADPAGESSSRWFWGFALVLVGLEAWMRRRSPRSTVQEVHADAA
jgi:hypothetical protein